MTEMKRVTVSFPDAISQAVFALRKTDEFARCSYSEIVRQLVQRGLDQRAAQSGTNTETEGR